MKRQLLILATTIFIFGSVKAQDTIVTTAGKLIEAKILELTKEKLSYKKFNYQDGATIVIDVTDVQKIIWQNGDVDEFNVANVTDTALDAVTKTGETEEERDFYDKSPILKESENVLPYLIERKKGVFYFDNGDVLYLSEFEDFLIKNNLADIWINYNTGERRLQSGFGLLGAGLALEAVGVLGIVAAGHDRIEGLLIIGSIAVGIGTILEIASIPTLIVGGSGMARSINEYNERYAGKPAPKYTYTPTLRIGATSNGIGFTLNF